MDINQFLISLLHALSALDFIEKIDFQTEVFVLKGRAILKEKRFLQIYFNEVTGTTAFSLIEDDIRIWGIDFDNLRGWHLHPLKDSQSHQPLQDMTIDQIIKDLSNVWASLTN